MSKHFISIRSFSVLILSASILAACGIIDTEQAEGVVELRTQILEIQTNEVEPLTQQISDLAKEIEPLEKEIEDLEDQRDDLWDEGDRIGRQFENEMRAKFESLFMEGDEARMQLEEAIDIEFSLLEDEQDALKEEQDALEDQFRDLDRQRNEIERGAKRKFDDLNKEVEKRRGELEKTHKGAFKSFENERRSIDEERERRQKENDKKVKALWPEFEKLMKSKEKEMSKKYDALREELLAPLKAEREAYDKAREELQNLSIEINLKRMEIEEQRMALDDQIWPLEERREELHKEQRKIHDTEPPKDYESLNREYHNQLDQLHKQVDQAYENANRQNERNSEELDRQREEIYNEFETAMGLLEERRRQGYEDNNNQENSANAAADIEEVKKRFANDIEKYKGLLADEEKKIASILAESTGNTENAERSSLTAEVEGIRADLEQRQQQLSETPETISSGDQPNPDYGAIQQRLDAAKSAVQQYQNMGYLGVKLAETSDSSGVQVEEVSPGTVAEGILQVGDVITSVNAQVITDVASYNANNFTPGQSIEGEITRSGDTVSFSVTLTEHPSYVTANADKTRLESSLANTPETISSGDQPNPDHSNLKAEIQNLEQRLGDASVKLEEANKADTSITSPELTAAYSRSHEYKIILGDLEINREQKIAQLNEQASNAGPTVNINDLENEIDGQRRQAEEERDRKLKELEDNFGGGQSGKPEGVVALEVQIDAIESDMDALWQER